MGRVFKPKYSWYRPDGTRVEGITTAWYVEYTDANHKQIRRKAGITKEQALDVLRKLEGDVLSEKFGLPVNTPATIVIDELLNRFIAYQESRASAGYCKNLRAQIRFIVDKLHAIYLRELTPVRVEQIIGELAKSARAPRTVNGYLKAIKRMLRWAVKMRLVQYNHLDCVSALPETDLWHRRRALSEDEIAQLLHAALEGPMRRRLRSLQNRPRKDGTYKPKTVPEIYHEKLVESGENNVLAYRLMLEIGLRKSEAASVTWRDVDLTDGTITIRSEWKGNKNGRETVLPLTPGLKRSLRQWREKHPVAEESNIVRISDRLLRCFKEDLVAANIARRVPVEADSTEIITNGAGAAYVRRTRWKIDTRDGSGCVLDLHALRHTFGTRLGRMPEIDVKSIQALMRHSDLRLTFGVYVHSDTSRLKAAVSFLPEIAIGVKAEPERLEPDQYMPSCAI